MKPSIALALSALVVAGCGGGGGGSSSTSSIPKMGPATKTTGGGHVQLGPSFGSFAKLPGILKTAPPWGPNNGAQLKPRLLAIGLQPLSAEGTVVHIHQHLDLYVDGAKVTVPAEVGIDGSGQFISDLHTHDTTGVMHVESATASSFSLGQFFGVWGVPLSAHGIGSLRTGGGKVLRAWVNGHSVAGDPTRIVLAAHQEIVIAYGTPAQMPPKVPASYAFPAGL